MDNKQLAEIALKAGEILLTSGAEIYRVEDTVSKICLSYGATAECFVLPTGIFISINNQDEEPFTSVKRIKQRSVDLDRIDAVNTFSRKLKDVKLPYADAIEELERIAGRKVYGFPLRIGVAGLAAFIFALLFEGSIGDGIAAFFIGAAIYVVKEVLARKDLFYFFELFVAGLAAGAASSFAVWLFPQLNIYKIIIGAIMMFLPGVAITNSIKDILYGDIVASITRMGEAAYSVAAVGTGVGIAISVFLSWGIAL